MQLCVIYTGHVANANLSTLHLSSSVSLPFFFFQHLFSMTLCTCTLYQSKSASPAYYSTIELPLWICLHNMYKLLDISDAQTIFTACYYLLCLTFLTTFKNVLYYLLRSTTLTVFVFCHQSKIDDSIQPGRFQLSIGP